MQQKVPRTARFYTNLTHGGFIFINLAEIHTRKGGVWHKKRRGLLMLAALGLYFDATLGSARFACGYPEPGAIP